MENRLSRFLMVAVLGMFVPAWMSAQDRAGDYALYDSVLKDANPETRLEKLQEWRTQFPTTEFAVQRKQIFLRTYAALDQPREAVEAAKQILADNPKDYWSLYYTMSFTRALAGTNPMPEVLNDGEKAAAALLANIDAPPPGMTANEWRTARTPVEALDHATLGWIALQRNDWRTKSWETAEREFQKSLELDPNNAEVDYLMGSAIAEEKKVDRMPLAFFYFARAATYSGPGELSTTDKEQALHYVRRQYRTFHGGDDGLDELLAYAKAHAAPTGDGITITAAPTGVERVPVQDGGIDRTLALWKNLKAALLAPDGQAYFDAGLKDVQLPTFKGKVVKLDPETNPRTVVLSIEDGVTPDATLKFRVPLEGTVDTGTMLSFVGVGESYTASPFMIVFRVETDDLHGWTGRPSN